MKIAVKLPEQETYGAWVETDTDSDIHIYVSQNGAVIGKNKDRTTTKFSPLALVLQEKNCYLQYKGEDGEAKNVSVSQEILTSAILKLLENLKEKLVVE